MDMYLKCDYLKTIFIKIIMVISEYVVEVGK